jgi:hypothetical protein
VSNLIANAQAWLVGKFRDHASVAAVYSRFRSATTVTCTVNVTLGRHAITESGAGVTVIASERELSIPIDELILDAVAAKPERGDKITLTINGELMTYEVMPVDRQHCFSHDPGRNVYRVYCKRIG